MVREGGAGRGFTERWLDATWTSSNPWLVLWQGRLGHVQSSVAHGGGGGAALSSAGSWANPFCGVAATTRFGSGEGPSDIEVGALPQHVVAGPGQLVGDGLDGDHAVALGPLALVVTVDDGVVAHREVGRLQVGLRRAYLLPFLVLPWPLRLPLDNRWLPTQRQ